MKRDSRITADITEASHDLLKAAVIKFDSSKGKLLEKMIKNFLGGDTEPVKQEVAIAKVATKRFTVPMLIDVGEYMFEKTGAQSLDEAAKFCDFYESNGWKVGKNKMKCWKAAVRNWLKGNNNGSTKSTSKKLSAYERTRAANSEYRQQPNECEVAMGADGGHMGGAVDTGEGRATIEHVDTGTFVDYE